MSVVEHAPEQAQVPPELSPERLLEVWRQMVTLRALDTRALNLQRQGRISFYAPSTGQEAAMVGSAFALGPDDWIFPSYREQGVLLVRGATLRRLFDQLFGNAADPTKGRQMPNHWGFRDLNAVSISSPVGTQIAQAPGFAYAQKVRRRGGATIVYFGDGATSEGDFHAGMNFAGVWRAPCVFFCQNNQWAITVPCGKQTASESIAAKAQAYGFEGIRVDGNDVLAVYRAARSALERARSGGGPTLIEAFTYRMGPHSTSDDPRRYRPDAAVEPWRAKDPIARCEKLLRGLGLLDDEKARQAVGEASEAVREASEEAEREGPPEVASLFDDVTARRTPALEEQRAELEDWLGRCPR